MQSTRRLIIRELDVLPVSNATEAVEREEQLEMRATAEFDRKLARVSTPQEAHNLAPTKMSQRAPGYRLYRNLAHFLQFGTPPDGASEAEVQQLRALGERLQRL